MKLELSGWKWDPVHRIAEGSHLKRKPKSKRKTKKGVHRELRESCKKVEDEFGCYCWKVGRSVRYCGSFSRKYKTKQHKTNLAGRIHQYWYNHRKSKKTKKENTNRRIFGKLLRAVRKQSVTLCILRPGRISFGATNVSAKYSMSPGLVRAVEQLLIYHYRQSGKRIWNLK